MFFVQLWKVCHKWCGEVFWLSHYSDTGGFPAKGVMGEDLATEEW